MNLPPISGLFEAREGKPFFKTWGYDYDDLVSELNEEFAVEVSSWLGASIDRYEPMQDFETSALEDLLDWPSIHAFNANFLRDNLGPEATPLLDNSTFLSIDQGFAINERLYDGTTRPWGRRGCSTDSQEEHGLPWILRQNAAHDHHYLRQLEKFRSELLNEEDPIDNFFSSISSRGEERKVASISLVIQQRGQPNVNRFTAWEMLYARDSHFRSRLDDPANTSIFPNVRFKHGVLPSLILAALLIPAANATATSPFETASGVTAGLLSIYKANITPTKDESYQLLQHVIQAITILALIIYAGCGTMRRSNMLRQVFVLCSLACGVSLAAWYPGRRFETCLEGFVALGFFAMGFVFDNASSWWSGFWRLLDRIRPRGPPSTSPV